MGAPCIILTHDELGGRASSQFAWILVEILALGQPVESTPLDCGVGRPSERKYGHLCPVTISIVTAMQTAFGENR